MYKYYNPKYEHSLGVINLSADSQSLLIVINTCPCISHLPILGDINRTQRNPVFTHNPMIFVSVNLQTTLELIIEAK